MLNYSANVLLLQHLVMQAREDTTARPGRTDGIETTAAAMRVRADAAEFLSSVQTAYHEIQDAASAVMEVIFRRRLAWPIANEDEEVVSEKVCGRCGERLPAIQFYTVQRAGYAPRLDSWCRSCRREYNNLRVAKPRSIEPKRCPDCEQTLAASEFSADQSRYDGLCAHCRTCKAVRKQAAKRGWRGPDAISNNARW